MPARWVTSIYINNGEDLKAFDLLRRNEWIDPEYVPASDPENLDPSKRWIVSTYGNGGPLPALCHCDADTLAVLEGEEGVVILPDIPTDFIPTGYTISTEEYAKLTATAVTFGLPATGTGSINGKTFGVILEMIAAEIGPLQQFPEGFSLLSFPARLDQKY